MIPANIRAAARKQITRMSRRDTLIMGMSAVAVKVADIAVDKLLIDPLLDVPPAKATGKRPPSPR